MELDNKTRSAVYKRRDIFSLFKVHDRPLILEVIDEKFK